MTIEPTEIGSRIYLFENPEATDSCVITTHGGYWRSSHQIDLTTDFPGVSLLFYSPHGTLLTDPGINFLKKQAAPMEEYPKDGKRVTDYKLMKYQTDKDGQPESYRDIQQLIEKDIDDRQTVNSAWRDPRMPLEIAIRYEVMLRPAHIVTVRKRHNKIGLSQNLSFNSVTLSEIIRKVRNYKPAITRFHCLFCRGHMANPFAKSGNELPTLGANATIGRPDAGP